MIGNITITVREEKTAQNGDPYLRIKSDSGTWFSCWEQALFHLLTVGTTRKVSITDAGKFKNITDVIDPDGTTHVTEQKPAGPTQGYGTTAWDKVFERFDRIEKKLDILLAKLPDQMDPDSKVVNLEDKLIRPEDIPF